MPTTRNEEDTVICPIEGCEQEVTSRGLYMHIYHTNDDPGEGHYPKYELPPDIDEEEIKPSGTREVAVDYPETQDLGDTTYFDTYTGKCYEGKRGLMVHLGQLAGRGNIPEDITDRHDADDFPIVEADDDGKILEVLKPAEGDVPSIEPYLPGYSREDGYIPKRKVKQFVEDLRNGSGAATADQIEETLLE